MLLSKEYVVSRTDNGLAETCSHQTCKTLGDARARINTQ